VVILGYALGGMHQEILEQGAVLILPASGEVRATRALRRLFTLIAKHVRACFRIHGERYVRPPSMSPVCGVCRVEALIRVNRKCRSQHPKAEAALMIGPASESNGQFP
jgi:hypothetical protein